MAATLRRCDACATPVDEVRVLCPQCGVDLRDPTAPIVWPDALAAYVPAVPPPPRRWPRILAWVGMLVVVTAVVVAGTLTLWPTSDPDAPVMPQAQRDASEETVREIAEIGTARAGDQDAPDSDPQAMLDDENTTAWFGDAPVLGFVAREQIVLHLAEPAWVSRLVVANGVHAGLVEYDAHGRARTIELMFDGGQTHTATLLDIGLLSQQIELPEPTLTTSLRITVLGVYPGQEHRDVALTAFEVHGYTPTAAQQALGEQRAEDTPAVESRAER